MTLPLAVEAQRLLKGAGYWTVPDPPTSPRFDFEDDVLVGRVVVHESANALLAQWQTDQDAFFQDHAVKLRAASRKAWNAYLVFIVSSPIAPEQLSKCTAIEEDLRAARKIVAGVSSSSDVRRALSPLLQIQSATGVGAEDLLGLLRDRLGELSPRTVEQLVSGASEDAIWESLLEDSGENPEA